MRYEDCWTFLLDSQARESPARRPLRLQRALTAFACLLDYCDLLPHRTAS